MAEVIVSRERINGRTYNMYTYKGETHNRDTWAEKMGITSETFSKWFHQGMSFAAMFNKRRHLYGGEVPSVDDVPFGQLTDEEVRKNLRNNCMKHDCKYLFAPGEWHRKNGVKGKEGIRVCHYMLWNNRRRGCDPRECECWRDESWSY